MAWDWPFRYAAPTPILMPSRLAPRMTAAADTDPTRDRSIRRFPAAPGGERRARRQLRRITALLDSVEQLRQQNAQLREREAQYQRLLTEANRRLQAQGQAGSVAIPPAAITAAARDRVPSAVQSRERKRERHDD